MQGRQKLLMIFMVGGLMLFYGTSVAADLTPPEIAEIALGSTVHLSLRDAKGNSWTGSGFVFRNGQIATNYHVIDNMSIGGARLVGKDEVYTIEEIVDFDREKDLAIVKVRGVKGTEIDVPALPLGDSDAVQTGEKVYVAGNPQGLEGTFSGGMISALRPEGIPLVRGKTFQMDAAISPGSSGGPVLNSRGKVIGIAVGHRVGGQNLNFAIPVNYLKLLANIPITPTPVKPKPVKPKVDLSPTEEPAKPQTESLPATPKQVKPQADPSPADESTKPQVEPKEFTPKVNPLPAEPKPNLSSEEIARIALGSTVHIAIIDDVQNNIRSTGSGFFVGPNQIATNYHVIKNLLIAKAKLVGGAKLVGEEEIYAIENIVGFDRERDLAIVKVIEVKSGKINAPALPLGDSDTVQIGKQIYVAGNPLGHEGTFSDGIISGIRGDSTDKLFQMTAPISPGSSGGPVLNKHGEVIGISVGGMEDGQNLNFAIAVNHLKQLAKRAGIIIKPTPPKPSPIVKHTPPSSISVSEIIPLTVSIDSPEAPRQVTIHYRRTNGLAEYSQEMLRAGQSASSMRIYKADLPPQQQVGSIEYHIEIEYENQVVFRYPSEQNRHYQISIIDIVDGESPTISLLYPPDDAKFGANQEVTFRAEVTDNIAVKEVHIHTSWFNGRKSHKLAAVGSPDIYTIDITFANIIHLDYYLTATDEAGNKSRSESRRLEIKIIGTPKLERGIKLYEDAKYSEAIKDLSAAIQEIRDSEPRASERRAEAYLYLGGATRGAGEGNDKVRGYFEESIRHNPNQELPPRLGKDHPIFAELIEEVRNELTGELTVISLQPETEIWISGMGTGRKMLGTGIVKNRRLLKGRYTVEGIYEGGSKKKIVTIEPNSYREIDLEIAPIVKTDFSPRISIGGHDAPLRISVGEIISLTFDLISTKSPQQVTIYYTTYDKNRNELDRNSQEMRLWAERPALSMWVYKVDLPPQEQVGSIEYYIEIEYEDHGLFEAPGAPDSHYQIFIVDEKPPTISLLDPPDGEAFERDETVAIRAEVSASVPIGAVHVHFSASDSQEMFQENYSDVYTKNITVSERLRYYVTATDEAGNIGESESRWIEIIRDGTTGQGKDTSGPGTSGTGTITTNGSGNGISPTPAAKPEPPVYEGIWAGAAANVASTSDWNTFRLAYRREGRLQPTLGAQLDVSYPDPRTNLSAMVQWEPLVKDSKVGFTVLGGLAAYEDAPGSTHTTPLLGAGLQFYPHDKIVIDATGSVQFLPESNTIDLYHYEVGIRFYITRDLGLSAGYGKLYLSDQGIDTIQVGLGITF